MTAVNGIDKSSFSFPSVLKSPKKPGGSKHKTTGSDEEDEGEDDEQGEDESESEGEDVAEKEQSLSEEGKNLVIKLVALLEITHSPSIDRLEI